MTRAELAAKIDHTILNADASFADIRDAILYAKQAGAASVCLNPAYVGLAAGLLRGSGTAVCTVIGFPLGANATYTKAKETENAWQHGAREMDMVLNISALKSGNLDYVKNDIAAVVGASPALVKVILETCTLTDEEIVTACRLATEAGAHYVKTSTGFGAAGASAAHVRLMRTSIPEGMKVKAAGGIRTLADALAMLEAGADRIGMSKTAAVLDELDAAGQTKLTAVPGAKKATLKATKSKAPAKKTLKTTPSKPSGGIKKASRPTSQKDADAKDKSDT